MRYLSVMLENLTEFSFKNSQYKHLETNNIDKLEYTEELRIIC